MIWNAIRIAAVGLALGLGALAAFALDAARVEFEAGNDNAAIDGTIVGDEYLDYFLGAKAG